MLRWLTVAVAVFVSSMAQAKPADCLLIVDGRTQIDGACEFYADQRGFQIRSFSKPMIVVHVPRMGQDGAYAFWNERSGVNAANSNLGDLTRDGACWVNARTRVCAWKLGETRTFDPKP